MKLSAKGDVAGYEHAYDGHGLLLFSCTGIVMMDIVMMDVLGDLYSEDLLLFIQMLCSAVILLSYV